MLGLGEIRTGGAQGREEGRGDEMALPNPVAAPLPLTGGVDESGTKL